MTTIEQIADKFFDANPTFLPGRGSSTRRCVETVLEWAQRESRLREPGTPTKRGDIRKGDLIRLVDNGPVGDDGERDYREIVFVAGENKDGTYQISPDDEYYIIERPKPELPTDPGVRFVAKSHAGPVEWFFITTADDQVLCYDYRDFAGNTWPRESFLKSFTVTRVLP